MYIRTKTLTGIENEIRQNDVIKNIKLESKTIKDKISQPSFEGLKMYKIPLYRNTIRDRISWHTHLKACLHGKRQGAVSESLLKCSL